MASVAVGAVHWLGALAALGVLVGSGFQAHENLAEYRAELAELGVGDELEKLLELPTFRDFVRSSMGSGGIAAQLRASWRLLKVAPKLSTVGLPIRLLMTLLRIRAKYAELRPVGEGNAGNARRLRQLVSTAAIWTLIMFGALLATAAAGVQLAIDHGAWS
jgi:hypothetical protein